MSGGQVICINGVIGVITGGDSELRTTYAVCSETVDQVIRCWLASRCKQLLQSLFIFLFVFQR